MDRSEHNHIVALSRWNKVFAKETATILKNTKKYPELKAAIIGYLFGDGCVSIRKERDGLTHYSIGFYPDDVVMLKKFMYAFEKIYEMRPHVKKEFRYYRLRIDSKAIVFDLLSYGSFGSMDWCVPHFQSSIERKWFLSAFYDAEGCVGKVIAVQSVNKAGLEQIRELLSEFSIHSKLYVYHRKNKNWNTNYLLYISRRIDKITFLKEIGFSHSLKAKKLQQYAGVA